MNKIQDLKKKVVEVESAIYRGIKDVIEDQLVTLHEETGFEVSGVELDIRHLYRIGEDYTEHRLHDVKIRLSNV